MPRIRQVQVTDRATGATTVVHAEVLLDDAGYEQRFRELKDVLPDVPGDRTARMVCDGCGTVAVLDYDRPVLPAGWAERPGGDFCPRCA